MQFHFHKKYFPISALVEKAKKIGFFLCFTIILLWILILSSPIFLFRQICKRIVKFLRPDLDGILSPQSTCFTLVESFENQEAATLMVHTLKGNLELDFLLNTFTQKVFPLKIIGNDGELRYPELKQYWVDWMGFRWWKNDTQFDIKNHISLYKSKEVVGWEKLHEIRQELLKKPFLRDKSPWEFVLIQNYKPEEGEIEESKDLKKNQIYSVLLFRCHHALADGYSILKLLYEGIMSQSFKQLDSTSTTPSKPVSKQSKLISISSLIDSASFLYKILYEISQTIILSMSRFPNSVYSFNQTKYSNSSHAVTKRISLQRIKRIRNHFGVNFSSVGIAACVGAMNEILLRKGKKLNKDVTAVLPYPIPGHPDQLRNHMALCALNLPNSSENRLKLLHESYEYLKTSTVARTSHWGFIAVGCLWIPLIKIFWKALIPPVLVSNLPGIPEESYLDGHEFVDQHVICGLLSQVDIGFWIMSYGGSLRIGIHARNSLLSEEDVKEMRKLVEKEFDLFETQITVNLS